MKDSNGRSGGSTEVLIVEEYEDNSCLNSNALSSTSRPPQTTPTPPRPPQSQPYPPSQSTDKSGNSNSHSFIGPAIGGAVGGALLVGILFALFHILRRKRSKQRPQSTLWSEGGDAHAQYPLNGVEEDQVDGRVPIFPNDAIQRPHFLDVPPSTSSEPSWNQSHRNLVSKPLEGNGSGSAIHVRGQTDLLRANTPTSGYTSTPPDAASEPSSRFIVHTDAGMIMNSRQSREQIEQDVVELPPRYDTVA